MLKDYIIGMIVSCYIMIYGSIVAYQTIIISKWNFGFAICSFIFNLYVFSYSLAMLINAINDEQLILETKEKLKRLFHKHSREVN